MTASTSSIQTTLSKVTTPPNISTEHLSESRSPDYDFCNTYPEAWEEAFQCAEALSHDNENSPNNVSTRSSPSSPSSSSSLTSTPSPFSRYRSYKNFLVVTDIASLAWCEQQFDYSLASGGRAETLQEEIYIFS